MISGPPFQPLKVKFGYECVMMKTKNMVSDLSIFSSQSLIVSVMRPRMYDFGEGFIVEKVSK